MTMYNNKFIATVKVNGQILREDKDIVYLPFGSEYSIFMKNLESRTAVVEISIDGQDVLDGNQLVIYAGSELNLEGFMKASSATNKFKFIQKTEKIQEHRGDKIDDGIVRITFRYEKPKPFIYPILTRSSYNYLDEGLARMSMSGGYDSTFGTISKSINTPKVDEGITVKGSESYQNFKSVTAGELETETHCIVLKLMGVKPETEAVVAKPVTVKTKKTCSTCGTVNKGVSKYCRECGTFLD